MSVIHLGPLPVCEPAGARTVRHAAQGVLAGARVLAARAVRAAARRRGAGGQPRRGRHAQPGRVDRPVLPRRRRVRARRQRRVHAHGHGECNNIHHFVLWDLKLHW